eukprot:gene32628-43603_t
MQLDATGSIEDLLGFWFAEGMEARWFASTPEFDREILRRFGAVHQRAAAGGLDHWSASPEGALALILALDQFPRNMFRGTPRAFVSDAKALEISRAALAQGFDQARPPRERPFFYLPLSHSEAIADQDACVRLHEELNYEDYLDHAIQHRDIIARFGRFPHRNRILGRQDTADEREFLKTHKGF